MSSKQAQSANADGYRLGDVLPHDTLAEVPAGTSVLVAGPAMTGKAALVLDVLSTGTAAGQHAIVVSPDRRAGRLLDSFDGDDDRLWLVDCSGSSGRGSFEDSEHVSYVSSPGDLTGVGIGIAKMTRSIGPQISNGLQIGVLSVSTLLQYSGQDRVFNFLHVLTGRIAAGDYLGIFAMDPGAHDESTTNVITSQFDVVVDIRETDDGRECRLRGLGDAAREWQAF